MANTQPSRTPAWGANNTGAVNKFGAPPNNGNRQPISQANTFSTQDYTGRNDPVLGANAQSTQNNPQWDANAVNDISSPLAIATAVKTLIIPPNAVSVTLIGDTAFSFSEFWSGTGALAQYVTWPAGTPIKLDTARISRLYVSGTTGNLSFFFTIM